MAEFIDDGSLYEEAKSLYKKIYYKIQDHPPFKEDVENALRDMYWQGYNDAKADMEYERDQAVEKLIKEWQSTENPSNLTYADGLADAVSIVRGDNDK